MRQPQAYAVRTVERALRLLQELNRRPVSTVQELHERVGLPKATIVRLLGAMISDGYVCNDPRQGGYQVTSLVKTLSCGYTGDLIAVQVGRHWADKLTGDVKWPVSIATFNYDVVVVRYNTIHDSPMSPAHFRVNKRLNLLTRGLGRAFIAFCSDPKIEEIRQKLVRSDHPEDLPARDKGVVRHLLDNIRAKGYAERDPQVGPRFSSTVAVPIIVDEIPVATIGLTYFCSAVSRSEVEGKFVDHLKEASARIASEVQRQQRA